jgi:hypothetical protein
MKTVILALALLPGLCAAQNLMLLNQNIPNVITGNNDITGGELAALWLDGNTADQSGNGNNGTAVGNPVYAAGKKGKAGHAINLNGTSQYVTIGTAGGFANFTGGPYSFSMWINSPTLMNSVLFSSGSGLNINGYFANAGLSGINFYSSQPGTHKQTAVTAALTINTWYFIAFVCNGTTMSIYLNGVVQSTTGSYAPPASSTGTGFQLGSYDSGTYFWPGSIDDFRVYNRALSSAEVLTMFTNGAYGP